MPKTRNLYTSGSSDESSQEKTSTQAQVDRLKKKYGNEPKKQKTSDHTCTVDSDMKRKLEDIYKNVASLSVSLDKMNKKIGLILEVIEQRGTTGAAAARNKRSAVKTAFESVVEARMRDKRARPDWLKETSKFVVHGVPEDRMKKIREALIHGPDSPSGTAIKVAKALWDKNYIEKYLVGPKTRNPRGNERREFLPDSEELKLKESLEQLTCKFLNDNEWRTLVRDPINQATRDVRGWLTFEKDEIDWSADANPGTSGVNTSVNASDNAGTNKD